MTCPDNLLIGYRRGALSDEEQARLENHLGACPTCRLTLRVGSDFDQLLQTVPGDDLIAARFARDLAAQLAQGSVPPRRGMLRYAWVAAASIAIVASAGLAAARLGAWPFAPRAPLQAPGETVDGTAAGRARPKLDTPETAPPPAEPVAEEPVPPAPDSVRAKSAAELFARANALRRKGEPGSARALYRELQQRYPRSAEVEVSHVSLGRMLLEQSDARAALDQFERYLAKRPGGPLAEEALFGQASALERLGQSDAERRTWNALLAAYPSSVYAARARQRLERIP